MSIKIDKYAHRGAKIILRPHKHELKMAEKYSPFTRIGFKNADVFSKPGDVTTNSAYIEQENGKILKIFNRIHVPKKSK